MKGSPRRRAAIDTNTWISAAIFPSSVPGRAVRRAWTDFEIIYSEETLAELASTLSRKKFDRYFVANGKADFLLAIRNQATLVHVTSSIEGCRDPDDNKFLSLAVDGGAAVLITGDEDLLEMHPLGPIAIIRAADFLALA